MDPLGWLERVDPGTNRRIKGLRLVTTFALAWLIGTSPGLTPALPGRESLGAMAAGFALWGSISEAQTTRLASGRDLVLLALAATLGAASVALLASPLSVADGTGGELTLVSGAFLVGYLRQFGVLGAGFGSQVFIGQLLAYNARSTAEDLAAIGVSGLIAAVASVVPRLLSGPAERTLPSVIAVTATDGPASLQSPALRMGLQGACAGLLIVLLKNTVGLRESVWAITASTYVIAGSRSGTIERSLRRIAGTAIGVPIGLACLPIAEHWQLLTLGAAAVALVVYAMAMPERYDIACGAYAFALVVTLAVSGETSLAVLAARAWETLLGGAVGLAAATLLLPIQVQRRE